MIVDFGEVQRYPSGISVDNQHPNSTNTPKSIGMVENDYVTNKQQPSKQLLKNSIKISGLVEIKRCKVADDRGHNGHDKALKKS